MDDPHMLSLAHIDYIYSDINGTMAVKMAVIIPVGDIQMVTCRQVEL